MLQLEWAAMRQQLAAAKQAAKESAMGAAAARGGAGGGAGDEDESGSRPSALKKGAKAEFAPRAAEGGSSSAVKLLKAKTGASKRAAAV
jgi:hypothetical protein